MSKFNIIKKSRKKSEGIDEKIEYLDKECQKTGLQEVMTTSDIYVGTEEIPNTTYTDFTSASFNGLAMGQSGKTGEGIENIIKTSIQYETEDMDRSSAGRFSSKLISLEWAKIWVEIDKKKKLREWCTALYYGAKKEFSSKNGPFLKIY